MRLIIATKNMGKLREIKQILSGLDIEILSQAEAGADIEVEEDGTTFLENATKKATTLVGLTGEPCLADDSGLMVDYLNGEPGVYSARYAGENASDEDRINKLLNALSGVPYDKRTARFVAAMVLAFPGGKAISVIGECGGFIGNLPQGSDGFGYDPIFIVPEYNKSFAQLTAEEKNKISHRGMALEKLRNEIKKLIPTQ